jgi:hypothetical protein
MIFRHSFSETSARDLQNEFIRSKNLHGGKKPKPKPKPKEQKRGQRGSSE